MNNRDKENIIKDLQTPINARDVLVVEDIIDTGHTLSQVLKILNTREYKGEKLADISVFSTENLNSINCPKSLLDIGRLFGGKKLKPSTSSFRNIR